LSPHPTPVQIQLFETANPDVVDRIRGVNIDELRPIEALQLLHEVQQELKKQ
jgi:DNA mismatch repair protein MutS